jgi:glycosyltransferase involved in cell wall biosynthesis
MKLNFFFNPGRIEGYVTHGVEMLRAMNAEAWDVACIPDFFFEGMCTDAAVRAALDRALQPRGCCAGIKLNLALPYRVSTFSGNPRIFYTVCEVDRLPPDWVEALNGVDHVWTASEWGRQVFLESGVQKPIYVVPEGVDPLVFHPSACRSFPERQIYRFLAVGKLEERKNYAALFRAYCEEFGPDEPVELLVHFGHPADPYQFLFDLNLGLRHPAIRFSKAVATPAEMAAIYAGADAFVLPTRGEGWGLPIIEAMACGLPVITTGIGPVLEYATNRTALLLDYDLVGAHDPVYGDIVKWGRWAEPSLKQLRQFMRRLFENPEEGREMGFRASSEVRSNWTWSHAVRLAGAALCEAGVC